MAKWTWLVSVSVGLLAGCGSDVDNEDEGGSGTFTGGHEARASECDGPDADCPECLGCYDTVKVCMDAGVTCGQDCQAFMECAQAQEQPECDGFCCEPCRTAHPEGAAEMDQLMSCLIVDACGTSCAEFQDTLICK